LLLFIDEAVWGGSRAQSGKLKKLVTELKHDIEYKHGARFTVDSFMNVIFASNEKWVVPVGAKARRFCCLDLDDSKAGIHNDHSAYFKAIRDVPVNAFAQYLFRRDISKFNPRNIPTTNLLRDQKRRRFDTVTAWWDDLLAHDDIVVPYETVHGELMMQTMKTNIRHWGSAIANEELFTIYKKHKGTNRGTDRCSDLIRELRGLCTFKNGKKIRQTVNGKRQYVTVLPTLTEAREFFCRKIDDPDWFTSI
jgi:hypothetical protein